VLGCSLGGGGFGRRRRLEGEEIWVIGGRLSSPGWSGPPHVTIPGGDEDIIEAGGGGGWGWGGGGGGSKLGGGGWGGGGGGGSVCDKVVLGEGGVNRGGGEASHRGVGDLFYQ